MATGRIRTPQQRDARELALTRPADPYRGTMLDPFSDRPSPARPTGDLARPGDVPRPGDVAQPAAASRSRKVPAGTPAAATVAGLLALALSLAMALFGVSLLALLSLQSDYGAPDRSFYRGSDSGSAVLALVDFGLTAGCAVGGIMLMGGRVAGRIATTISGWVILGLSAFWYLRGHASAGVPATVALVAAAMLMFSYQRSVTRWLGVLPAPQPEP